jgi:hypothetical protein
MAGRTPLRTRLRITRPRENVHPAPNGPRIVIRTPLRIREMGQVLQRGLTVDEAESGVEHSLCPH